MPRRCLAYALAIVAAALWWFTSSTASRATALPSDICFVAAPTPYEPNSGIAALAPRQVPRGARCPVCGAFPSRAADWAAQVIFENGDAYFFDSPLSLFMYLRNPTRYTPGRHAAEIAVSYVRSMADGRWVDANGAVYVRGSSVAGPMREGNLPAFENAADARHFIARHGGEVVLASAIDNHLLEQVAPAHMHR
jgi:nitrous oxide reductase accessory protein NosL